MKVKKVTRILSIFFTLVLINLSAYAKDNSSQNNKNFLWKVQSKTNTVYVLGSIHFMKKEIYPLSKEIESAFDKSDVFVVEADVNDVSKIDIEKLIRTAFYPENDSLQNHISQETYGMVRKEFEVFGIPQVIADKQKPWILALTLESLELARLGYDPNNGIDIYFLSKASGKKKIKELESIDYQINLLSGFSDNDQEAFLLYTLKDMGSLEKEVDTLMRAWKSGDTKSLESIITKNISEDRRVSSIYEKLLYERNTNMVSRIEGFLKTKETHFVIVGAGHLVGNKGIIEILKKEGYLVEQL